MDLSEIKNRFGIIGNDQRLNTAIDTAIQIAGTNLSVLITGESGVGKEVIPKIIHAHSPRKHNNYIAINCGAIPEGTIESELFGHEKGSFTGANEARKGYFEVADGGTIFLDEVGELPLSTQVRLLRVLETGEFIRVGSSKTQKTDVRVIAASNVNFMHAISVGKFREDLYYRLNAVPISIPPLRERKGDIHLLFMKFALDFADKYKMPAVRLTPDARVLLESYRWPGNVRQLKNVAEQISVLENNRHITPEVLATYLPSDDAHSLPVSNGGSASDFVADRDILFKMIMQLRNEIDQLRDMIQGTDIPTEDSNYLVQPKLPPPGGTMPTITGYPTPIKEIQIEAQPQPEEGPKTLQDMSEDLIRKTLEKHNGKRKLAAEELGISERTLYRKIKDYKLK